MEYRGFEVEVVDAERKRVNRVRFRRTPVAGRRSETAEGRPLPSSGPASSPWSAGPTWASPRSSTGWSGQKVAIVSDKPQTTRNRILAVRQPSRRAVVLFDTPGIHKPQHRSTAGWWTPR